MSDMPSDSPTLSSERRFSLTLIALMKGVLYQDRDPGQWQDLLDHQARLRDHLAPLGLSLMLDEAEGYAYLSQRPDDDESPLPRLVRRQPLSYPVSLLLALLRKKLAEQDAGGDELRLILSREQIQEMLALFLADTSNEARLRDRLDSHINKVVELGFLRRLKGDTPRYEVRRLLKSFVDAQWLAEFEQRLAEYREHAEEER
ncbi:DUF4194 domain-containing protein [Halomonas sp. EGI 63088]|uniref:DUF4194 domain-containing protein n=1 Tax=Halomonas flagellata TaxID=2920385 RepID=A0ABS9RZM2_9GAMM|nr:DUF4194 domain-containing protein [Halomonas flagellata]MCH4565303.1 DUF4194 domain-containing protein [Halomonas flagellata]